MEAAGQWPQVQDSMKAPMEGSKPFTERKTHPHKDHALNCPRCSSANTKFCYFNNYSLSQPRYFCKACRRYWTEGGSLRNVPVGGGSRKNKRSSCSSPSSQAPPNKKLSYATYTFPSSSHLSRDSRNPKLHDDRDVNLFYTRPPPPDPPTLINISNFFNINHANPNPVSNPINGPFVFPPTPNLSSLEAAGLSGLSEFKPPLIFQAEGFESGFGNSSRVVHNDLQEVGARVMLPLEELKQLGDSGESNNGSFLRGRDGNSGIWNGMIGGGW